MRIEQVISGGQTGVDQAVLRAAQDCGLDIGGWCPPGRLCETGVIPDRFPLQETPEDRSPLAPDIPRSQRTEWNILDSDASLILRPVFLAADPGTDWAEQLAARLGHPALVTDPWDPDAADRIKDWLDSLEIRTLGVGGPSEGTVPGIGDQTYAVLVRVFGRD
ncbi:MAG TPA: putative molybdenum carrier protein [Thermoanaerobaculia bacterium]|nr:putative molybdenum carrier protein [Thermoanaerobaculia bacterium]